MDYETNRKGEDKIMEKTMIIEGMACGHCKARVEKALNGLDGVKAEVNLDKKCAVVKLSKEVADSVLKEAVEKEGYDVISIK